MQNLLASYCNSRFPGGPEPPTSSPSLRPWKQATKMGFGLLATGTGYQWTISVLHCKALQIKIAFTIACQINQGVAGLVPISISSYFLKQNLFHEGNYDINFNALQVDPFR